MPREMSTMWRELPRAVANKVGDALATKNRGAGARLVSRAWRRRANEAVLGPDWRAEQPWAYDEGDAKVEEFDVEWLGWAVLRRPGLTAEDARARGDYALRHACKFGYLEAVDYLCWQNGLTAEDARARRREARWGARISISLTAEASRAMHGEALQRARASGHLEVVQYLEAWMEMP